MHRFRYWAPVIAWAALIWYFSSETFAAASTSRFLEPLLARLLPWASAETLAAAHFLLRKLGHVAEYFVLALLLYRAIGAGGGWRVRWALLSFAVATGYAAADEIHQAFLPSRSGAVADVVLDAAGAAAALLLLRWRILRRRVRQPAAAAASKTPTEATTEE
jgi:VanZ family protein